MKARSLFKLRAATPSSSIRHVGHLALWFVIGCGGSQGRKASVTPDAMPRGGTFSGVWFSPQYGRMDLIQSGKVVIGEYEKDERIGRIEGKAVGNVMRFSWIERREMIGGLPQETRGRGYFKYLQDAEPDPKLVGEWGHDLDEVGGGPWNAVKSRKLKPQLSHASTSSTEGASSPNSAGSESQNEPARTDPPRNTPSAGQAPEKKERDALDLSDL